MESETDRIPEPLRDHPRYRIVRPLGEGGMGSVFLAEQRAMGRNVAIKVIRPALVGSRRGMDRFAQEVRAAAQMTHENVVRAYDADEAGGLHFLVMEYVEGTDLASLVAKHGPLNSTTACDYIRQAALGLQHAHELGMIHRDIKPANLMLTREGRIKILDFGIARFARAEAAPGLTDSGTLLGTVDYLAPEQSGDARSADIRSDIYSLGCTLYFLLTGQVPYPGGTLIDKVQRHASAPIPDPRTIRPDVPSELAIVVTAMMAKNPRDRFRHPVDIAMAMSSFMATGSMGPLPLRHRTTRTRLSISVVVAVVVAVAGVVIVASNWPQSQPEEPMAQVDATHTQPQPAPPQPPVEPPPPKTTVPSKLIAADGSGDYRTIKDAILAARDGDRFEIKPGNYHQSTVHIHARVTLVGQGPPGSVVIDADETTFHLTGTGIVLRNLTIRSASKHAIFSEGGDQQVEDCDFTGAKPNGIIVVQGERPRLTILRSKIHGAATNGLHVGPWGTVNVEETAIYDNAFEGVVVDRNTQLLAKKCRVHDNRRAGFRFLEEGRGRIEDCDVYGNLLWGVHVENRANPWVIGCRVNRNARAGIGVFSGGTATVEGCDLTGNLGGPYDVFHDGLLKNKDNREN